MIENEVELRATVIASARFMHALMERADKGRPDDVPLEIWQAQHDAMYSVMMDLRGEIADYLERRGDVHADLLASIRGKP